MLAPTLVDSHYLLAPENPVAHWLLMRLLCRATKNGHPATELCPLPSSAVPGPRFSHGQAFLLAFPAPKLTHQPTIHQLPSSPTCSRTLTMTLPMPVLGCLAGAADTPVSGRFPTGPGLLYKSQFLKLLPLYCFQKQPGVSGGARDRNQGSQPLGRLLGFSQD